MWERACSLPQGLILRCCLRHASNPRPPEIHEAVHNLRHALQLHHGRWSPEEITRVAALLNSTAQAIVDGPAVQPVQGKNV